MNWKTLVLLICYIFVFPFLAGFFGGVVYNEYKKEKAVEENYFDSFPSPLACHVDDSCSLKE